MRYNPQTKKVTTIFLDPEMMPSRSVSQASFSFSDNGEDSVRGRVSDDPEKRKSSDSY